MGEWTAISPQWWKGEESSGGGWGWAGQMTAGCINTKTDVRPSKRSGGGVALK